MATLARSKNRLRYMAIIEWMSRYRYSKAQPKCWCSGLMRFTRLCNRPQINHRHTRYTYTYSQAHIS